ncbi:MAG: GNAT family N-acetyltransferase [Flavisolibacter sp.]
MIFQQSVPILYSSDVKRSIQYYTEVLGFEHHWTWDDTPGFGGVSKDHVQVFFCKDGQGHPGTWMSIMVNEIDHLHDRIVNKGGTIVSEPEDKEWGLREMLVRDPDGHIIRFGQSASRRSEKSTEMPRSVSIIERIPTIEEYDELVKAVKWKSRDKENTATILKAPLYSVVAEDRDAQKTIGCVLLLGDGASFYYVKDMMIDPYYQAKHVGTALMQRLNEWLEANAAPGALVGLYTGENLAPFYRQFGFGPAFGMTRRIPEHR